MSKTQESHESLDDKIHDLVFAGLFKDIVSDILKRADDDRQKQIDEDDIGHQGEDEERHGSQDGRSHTDLAEIKLIQHHGEGVLHSFHEGREIGRHRTHHHVKELGEGEEDHQETHAEDGQLAPSVGQRLRKNSHPFIESQKLDEFHGGQENHETDEAAEQLIQHVDVLQVDVGVAFRGVELFQNVLRVDKPKHVGHDGRVRNEDHGHFGEVPVTVTPFATFLAHVQDLAHREIGDEDDESDLADHHNQTETFVILQQSNTVETIIVKEAAARHELQLNGAHRKQIHLLTNESS